VTLAEFTALLKRDMGWRWYFWNVVLWPEFQLDRLRLWWRYGRQR